MDLSIRDWMLVIGVLLILAVLLDGYRRVRKDRVRKVRMSLKPVPPGGGDDEVPARGELPNGGARVASRGNRATSQQQEPTFDADWQTEFRSSGNSASTLDDDDDLPDVDVVKSHFTSPAYSPAPRSAAKADLQPEPLQSEPAMDESVIAEAVEPVGVAHTESVVRAETGNEPVFDSESMTAVAEPVSAPAQAGLKEIIVVNAVSKDPAGFNGEELLHILLTCDLRFGKMNIFHRYEKSNAKGAVQFSVANSVEPGTFDLNNMRSFKTPGICLFLQLPGPHDAQKALEYMVETAQCIARNLNGELRDENRSALTAQTVEHFRSRIREFDRKRMAKHA